MEEDISFYIYDPLSKKQISDIQDLKKSLNKFSLNIEEKDKVWQDKILRNFEKDIKPFYENYQLIEYLTFMKYLNLRSNKNNYKQILFFILKKINLILKYIRRMILSITNAS